MACLCHQRGTIYGRNEEGSGSRDSMGVGNCRVEMGVGDRLFRGGRGRGVVERLYNPLTYASAVAYGLAFVFNLEKPGGMMAARMKNPCPKINEKTSSDSLETNIDQQKAPQH